MIFDVNIFRGFVDETMRDEEMKMFLSLFVLLPPPGWSLVKCVLFVSCEYLMLLKCYSILGCLVDLSRLFIKEQLMAAISSSGQ